MALLGGYEDSDMRLSCKILMVLLVGLTARVGVASSRAVALIKSVEGFSATTYRDAVGIRAIGYGFTSEWLVSREQMTKAEASLELSRICRQIICQLRRELYGQRLTEGEEAAVVSFIYNVGWANFKASTMCRLLKKGKRGKVVADEFTRWVYVTKNGRKVVCDGLKTRRAMERQRFMGC